MGWVSVTTQRMIHFPKRFVKGFWQEKPNIFAVVSRRRSGDACKGLPTPTKAPSSVGTGGKRVPSGHNAEGVSDPQVGSETSTDHGSGLYDD